MCRKNRVPLTARSLAATQVKNLSAQHRNPNSWDSSSACFGKLQMWTRQFPFKTRKPIVMVKLSYFSSCFNLESLTQKEHKPISLFFFLFSLSKNKIAQAWAVWLTKTNSLRRRLDPFIFNKNGRVKCQQRSFCVNIQVKSEIERMERFRNFKCAKNASTAT